MSVLVLTKGTPPTVRTEASVSQYLHDTLGEEVAMTAGQTLEADGSGDAQAISEIKPWVITIPAGKTGLISAPNLPYNLTIVSARFRNHDADITLGLTINGVNVTGLNGVTVTAATTTPIASTGANTATANQDINFSLSANASTTDIAATILLRKTGPQV